MHKTTYQILTAWLLVCALFTPTFLAIVDCHDDRVVLMSLIEEEPGKEDQKEVLEPDVYFEWVSYPGLPYEQFRGQDNFLYVLKGTDCLRKIILPPPEQLS